MQTSTASGSPLRRRSSRTAMTSKEGSSCDIPIHVLKYALAALIQGVAPALRHQFLQHSLHCLDSIHQIVQLGEFSLRQGAPALRSTSRITKTKKQVSDFAQCKTELACTLDDCQAIKHRRIVTSLSAQSLCPRKQANLFVIANRRGLQSNFLCNLRNGQLSHARW